MAGKSRFQSALNAINSFFSALPHKVFSEGELRNILEENRDTWSLPYGMFPKKFIEELIKYTGLEEIRLVSVGKASYAAENLVRYSYGASVFEIALSIKPRSYLSHYSSVFLHGLTQQIPKTIYVTFEQSEKKGVIDAPLIEQSAIDRSFSKPQREPSHYYSYLDYKIVLHNGMFTKNAGVSRTNSSLGQNITATNLERTLIDITVRPAYSGGINEVLNAYREAKSTLSVNKLSALLSRLKYKYPYHQSIGFYLEKAGYKDSQVNILKSFPQKNDFYLTYEMKDPEYSSNWKLYYPKNL